MTTSDPAERVVLRSAVPGLPVADIERAVDYYEGTLGFARRVVKEDFAAVHRDDVEVHVWLANGPEGSGAEPYLVGTGECWIEVSDLTSVAAEYRERGVTEASAGGSAPEAPARYPIRDLDGNTVTLFEASS
jgi:catechol 2,3-dioxygenase-like lactoylglutathione lyase family enzyme